MLKCMMTNSTQWAENQPLKRPKGVVIHSTKQNGAYLRKYIQPSKSDEDYDEIMAQLGKNRKHNDWNHICTFHNFHYWIGKNKEGKVITVQTFPLTIQTWPDNYIHICVCEDNLKDRKYLEQCLNNLIELCSDIAVRYLTNTKDILDYSELSDHPDISYWLKKYGYSMKWLRVRIGKLTWQKGSFLL